tara:strand:+ start:193 stop:327 length:135 start_codon:yes stop_codon:yes gene_type:complete
MKHAEKLTREEYIRRTTENGKALVRRWGEIAREKQQKEEKETKR